MTTLFSIKDGITTVHINGQITLDQFEAICKTFQDQVAEILTGPGNSPEILKKHIQDAEALGIMLDTSASSAMGLVDSSDTVSLFEGQSEA